MSAKFQIMLYITSETSNKVHSGVKISNFGNAVWFLLFVKQGNLYCANFLFFEKNIIDILGNVYHK